MALSARRRAGAALRTRRGSALGAAATTAALLGPGRRLPARLPLHPESPAARRRRERAERRTLALAALAVLTGGGVVVGELTRTAARQGALPGPVDATASLAAVEGTVEVALEGWRGGSEREHALLNLLLAFSGTWAVTRLATHVIRRRGRLGPFRNLVVGRTHVHHFVPGIVLAFLAGGVSVVTRAPELERWLAVPFGAGVALTLDESALLLRLDDVYWSEEGVVSVQVSLATIGLLSTLALVLRVLRRGERAVLTPPPAAEAAVRG